MKADPNHEQLDKSVCEIVPLSQVKGLADRVLCGESDNTFTLIKQISTGSSFDQVFLESNVTKQIKDMIKKLDKVIKKHLYLTQDKHKWKRRSK